MKMVCVMLLGLVSAIVCAAGETNAPSYVLDLSSLPPLLREYVEKAPDSFVKNMSALIDGGMSEEKALEVVVERLCEKINRHEAEKAAAVERAKLEKDVLRHLGYMQRKAFEREPEKYWAAVKRFGSGEQLWHDDLWRINIKKKYKQEGYERAIGADQHYLYAELANANMWIVLRREVWLLEYYYKQLGEMCAPHEMPVLNVGYRDRNKSVRKRLELAKAERSKITHYVKYYAAQEARWADLMYRLSVLEEQARCGWR